VSVKVAFVSPVAMGIAASAAVAVPRKTL